jgi:general secretion pathway protein C
MKIRTRDHYWLAGLVIAILLLSNIAIQATFHKSRIADIQFSEEVPNVESKDTAIIAGPRVPAKERKSQITKLELLGTILGQPSMAFIYNPQTQTSGLYKINDSLDNFKISKILPGKILLERAGEAQELFLTSRMHKQVKDTESFVAKDESGTMIISKFQMLAQMFKANEIISKIKIMPLADSQPNKLMGFRIDNVPSGSIIEEAGIKNGDIIYSIQGQRLQSMQDALTMFNRIQNQPRIEVVLLRDRQPVTLKYEIH